MALLAVGRTPEIHAQGALGSVIGAFVGTVVGQDHLFVAVVALQFTDGAASGGKIQDSALARLPGDGEVERW